MNDDITYIDTHAGLAAMCEALQEARWLAVDTEFIRVKSYFPHIALIQVASAERVYCVDVPTTGDVSKLFALLEQQDLTCVFHSAGQDLEICYIERGKIPFPVFDTQIAVALLGLGEQLSYSATVKALLDVELGTSRARTDWMKRPLDPNQLRYAADDVRYLARLYPKILAELERLGRVDWLFEEVERQYDPAGFETDLSACWERVKGAGKLKRNELNILKHLAAWRETQAVSRDLPRKWVLSDEGLLAIATARPKTKRDLLALEASRNRVVDRHAGALAALVSSAEKEPESAWPRGNHRKRPSEAEEAAMESLMSIVTERADALGIAPGRITTKSDLLRLIRGERGLPILCGWRFDQVGKSVLDALDARLPLK